MPSPCSSSGRTMESLHSRPLPDSPPKQETCTVLVHNKFTRVRAEWKQCPPFSRCILTCTQCPRRLASRSLGSLVRRSASQPVSQSAIAQPEGAGSAQKNQLNAPLGLEAPAAPPAHAVLPDHVQPDHVLGSPRHNLKTNRLFTSESEKWGFKEKLGSCCMLRPDVDRRNRCVRPLCCMLVTRRFRYNESKPLAVIGEITPAEVCAPASPTAADSCFCQIKALNGTCEPTHMAFGWVLRAIGRRSQQGGLNASPPVFSRVYQVTLPPPVCQPAYKTAQKCCRTVAVTCLT